MLQPTENIFAISFLNGIGFTFYLIILVLLAKAGSDLTKEAENTAVVISQNINELECRGDLNELKRMEFISFMLQIRSRNLHIGNTLFNINWNVLMIVSIIL